MSVVCEFELLSVKLPLTGVAATLETILTIDDVVSGTRGAPAVVFSTTGVDPDRLEAAMDEADPVLEYVALESAIVESRYRVVLDAAHADVYTRLVDLQTHPMGAVVTGRGWKVSAQFADRNALDSFRTACGETGVEFRPRRVFEAGTDPTDDYGLTAAQHEALFAAHEMGYFDVPREADLSDLAAELDTTTSALSERLRRGQRRLVGHTIASAE
ncbi:MAG: helix-turn-helix domain-containing protein [Halapricum sp.]